MRVNTIIAFIVIVFSLEGYAQEIDEFVTINTPLTIDLDAEEEERVSPKAKKRKKKVFYGHKTKKAFTKKGNGNRIEIQVFYYLKERLPLDPYVRDVYWFDFKRREIKKSKKIDPDYGVVLHGPYKRMIDNKVIEEGIYYNGMKHGRWTRYNNRDVLVDKRKYYKGWPKESLARFYDKERTELKEIIPVEYGQKEGNYYFFYKNGNIAVRGEYREGQKVGQWIEYWPRRGRRKKIIQYREDPYDDTFKPYTIKEWASNGKLVYDREVWKRQVKYSISSINP